MIKIERFIKLTVDKELDHDVAKKWFNCVKENAPSGVIKSINVVNDDGIPKAVSMVHRGIKKHNYIIPLTRNLRDNEIESIVEAFSKIEPELDFSIETDETKISTEFETGISLDDAKHLALCHALEKQKHEDWVRERTDGGWRYGQEYDADEKVHPLILPWDQLPDRYKKPDMTWPQKLIHMLNDNGYAVVDKNELEKLKKIIRDKER